MLTAVKCHLKSCICSKCIGIIEEDLEYVVLYPKYPKCVKSFAVSHVLSMKENKMFKMYLKNDNKQYNSLQTLSATFLDHDVCFIRYLWF